MILNQKLEFKAVKGIGDLELNLSEQKMHVLIGANGVGKTKTLEALYIFLLISNPDVMNTIYWGRNNHIIFEDLIINDKEVVLFDRFLRGHIEDRPEVLFDIVYEHHLPAIYLAAQNRGEIKTITEQIHPLGGFIERKTEYLENIERGIRRNFSSLNMNTNIEEWFIQRAYSATPYQDNADNREIELHAVLRILNQIDQRISADPHSLKIIGGKSISILLDGQPRLLNELSSGFSSLIKIVQSIVAGYSFFTNTREIEKTEGYVLIDEIESHLHVEWQAKILPLLAKVFPNTYFVITTHSSLVLAQLNQGSAYQLIKEQNKVVTKPISNPSQTALVDLLEEAFNINLNALKIQNTSPESQQQAKQALLDLIGG